MLKGVAILLAKLHDKLDDFRRCVRNLDGVRLNMGNSKAPFLYLVFEVYHEQSSTFRHNIV